MSEHSKRDNRWDSELRESKGSRSLLFNLSVYAEFGTAETHSTSHYRVLQKGLPEQVILSSEGVYLVI